MAPVALGQVVRKALPGLPVWAVLFLLAVPVAILANAMIVEVPPRGDDTFRWTRMTVPLAGAVAAARFTARTGRRRTLAGFASAVLAATLTGALYLTLSLLTYRWAVPLPDPAGGDEFLVLPAAVVGGAAGYGRDCTCGTGRSAGPAIPAHDQPPMVNPRADS